MSEDLETPTTPKVKKSTEDTIIDDLTKDVEDDDEFLMLFFEGVK